jgi:hypothetical protein
VTLKRTQRPIWKKSQSRPRLMQLSNYCAHVALMVSLLEILVSIRHLVYVYYHVSSKLSLGGVPPCTPKSSTTRVLVQPRPVSSPIFTGRRDILQKLEVFFEAREDGPRPRRQFLLYGMGGAGKSQIALKFSEENQHRCVV